MTYFFAFPDEIAEWLDAQVSRLGLVEDVEEWGGTRRTFVWPGDLTLPPRARGVVVEHPIRYDSVLVSSRVSWKPSGFDEPFASQGRRLNQQLVRSLRTIATIPLFPVSYDRTSRGEKPFAYGTPRAVADAEVLRQWRDGAVTFEP